MKKNVVFWVGVKNEKYSEKYGGWEWMDLSRKTWEYWCEKNDVLFFPFEEPIEKDLNKFRINWQKALFAFHILDYHAIDYDQIYLVDGMNMIKWDTPNVFELTDGKFTAWRDMDNLRWIKESVDGYKNFFDGFEINLTNYISSGLIIFNENHKEVFNSFKEFYYQNTDELVKLQDELVKKGTEQTPLNYWLQMNDVEIKTDLPLSYKLTHMHRKEVLGHNWQLNEDTTPFFIKYGYIWNFSGFPKNQRTSVMRQVWDLVKSNYTFDDNELLLNSVRHKDTFKNATSRKFKSDLIEFFKDDKYKDMTAVELGGCQGDTTKILGSLFKEVHSVDRSESNVIEIEKKCGDNVHTKVMDVTNDEWDFPKADVVFVDASHDYPQVAIDIQKSIDYFDNPIIILDDYGNPNNRNIRNSIDLKINEGKIKIDKHIGENVGYQTKSGWKMIDREGVICTS
jgi:hypothetical protein|tara:strand:+ start:3001 stop:4356 length:1356 start_codon:yes stop_codon:yes gene_type:complete